MISFILNKLNLSNNRRKIVLNVFWALLGKVVNIISSLFIGILVARYLGPEKYGLMNYVISYVSLFTIIASFGLDNIEVRELSRQNSDKNLIIGTAFRLKLLFAAGTLLLIIISLLLFEADAFTFAMVLIYSLTIFGNSFTVIRNYFTSIVQNEYIVKTEIGRTIFGAIIKIILLLVNASLTWFIVALTLDFVFISLGYVYSYKNYGGTIRDWKYNKKVAKHLLKESFPLLLSGAAVIIYQRIDQVMIGKMIDNEAVAYFSVAGKFTELILFLPAIMAQTVSPLLVRAREENLNNYNIKKQQFVGIVIWTAIVMSALVSLTAYWIISWTFGVEYLAAVPVLQVLSWKAVGMALSSSSGQLIIIEGIQKYAFIRNIIAAVLCISLNYWLIPIYGILGSAFVTIITVAFAGFFANIFIPPYHSILKLQLKALLLGWKDLVHIRTLFK